LAYTGPPGNSKLLGSVNCIQSGVPPGYNNASKKSFYMPPLEPFLIFTRKLNALDLTYMVTDSVAATYYKEEGKLSVPSAPCFPTHE
jgi:hypothetical protein